MTTQEEKSWNEHLKCFGLTSVHKQPISFQRMNAEEREDAGGQETAAGAQSGGGN